MERIVVGICGELSGKMDIFSLSMRRAGYIPDVESAFRDPECKVKAGLRGVLWGSELLWVKPRDLSDLPS